MTDFSWAKLAEDPNVIQWDEEAQANLQKLIADYERVKAENDTIKAGGLIHIVKEVWVKTNEGFDNNLYCWSDGVVTWKKER